MIPKYKLKKAHIVSRQTNKSYPSGTIVIKIQNYHDGRVCVENKSTGVRFVTTQDNLQEI